MDDVTQFMKNEQNITNMYMTCSYLDVMDNLRFSENSFFELYCFNEYVKDIYEQNKTELLKIFYIRMVSNVQKWLMKFHHN